jgi:hypothetical protein
MNRFPPFLLMSLLTVSAWAAAFESDVHYGLTQWLALKAGFDPAAARMIAIGDNRVDSGDMQFVDLGIMYACAAKDIRGSRRAGRITTRPLLQRRRRSEASSCPAARPRKAH